MSILPEGFINVSTHIWEIDQKNNPINEINVSDGLTATRTDNSVLLGIGSGIQFQSEFSSEASLVVSDTNVVSLTSVGNIVLQPGASAVQMTSTAPAITIQPLTNTDVMYVKGQLIKNSITGIANGSASGIGPSFVGYMNDITLTSPSGSNEYNLQFAGSGIVAGSIFEFFLNPASAGNAILIMEYNTTQIATFNFQADAGKFVRVYTPNGTDFYASSY